MVTMKAGDRVKWVHGGPVMVVETLDRPDPARLQGVTCVWFSPDDHFHRAGFLAEDLVPAGTPSSPPSS